MTTCLNCGAPLTGRFCAACGQRAVGAYPSLNEIAGDVWDEFVGVDGRFMRTLKALPVPGRLTVDVLEGRRARYISPVRLYLVASVVYFVIAVAAPTLQVQDPETGQMRQIKVGLWTAGGATAEDRADFDRKTGKAPQWLKPVMEQIRDDPDGLQGRIVTAMPKVLFALVPVFAGIIAMFYRRRPYPQHLIFALHLHAVIFLALAVAELPKFTGNVPVSLAIALAAILSIATYALRGFRRVYQSGWPATLAKAAGIALVYMLVSLLILVTVIVVAASMR